MTATRRLMVFTRYPEPGKTKTRLIAALGPQGAAGLHRRMAEHAVQQARLLCQDRATRLEIHYEGGCEASMQAWLGQHLSYHPQAAGDLGRRMQAAFERAFGRGVAAAIIMGTDCPQLTASVLQSAFEALERGDLALGPATDGGYYLIGLKRPAPALFSDIAWGTDRVLTATLAMAERSGLTAVLLDRLADVDRPEDLGHARAFGLQP